MKRMLIKVCNEEGGKSQAFGWERNEIRPLPLVIYGNCRDINVSVQILLL